MYSHVVFYYIFFFNDTATTEIYTLSLHDALPISSRSRISVVAGLKYSEHALSRGKRARSMSRTEAPARARSEEHTSELQSQSNLVCRLLLEKKKNKHRTTRTTSAPQSHHRPTSYT